MVDDMAQLDSQELVRVQFWLRLKHTQQLSSISAIHMSLLGLMCLVEVGERDLSCEILQWQG